MYIDKCCDEIVKIYCIVQCVVMTLHKEFYLQLYFLRDDVCVWAKCCDRSV